MALGLICFQQQLPDPIPGDIVSVLLLLLPSLSIWLARKDHKLSYLAGIWTLVGGCMAINVLVLWQYPVAAISCLLALPTGLAALFVGMGGGVIAAALSSIILAVSVVVWALSVLPGGGIESSYLAGLGRLLSPLGALMGLGWRMMVALLTSFVAKENTIATLGVLYGAGEEGTRLAEVMSGVLTPAAALAFLAVQMLFIPCVATVAVIRQETGSWRWTGFSVALLLVLSLVVGIAIYQGALLVGWGV